MKMCWVGAPSGASSIARVSTRGKPSHRARLLAAAALGATLNGFLLTPPTYAAAADWTNGASDNNWFTAGDWSVGVPAAADTANITSVLTTLPATQRAKIGASGAVASNVNLDWHNILEVNAGGTLTVSGTMNVGQANGDSVFNVNMGGAATIGTLNVGTGAGLASTVFVGGPGAVLNVTNATIGVNGTGNLRVDADAILNVNGGAGTLFIGSTGDGHLTIAGSTTPGTINAAAVNLGTVGSSITFLGEGSSTFSSPITGLGSLNSGPHFSTTILTGTNTYSGATTIDGRLQIGNGGTTGTLGTGTVTINSPGMLAFNRSDTIIVDNVISGTGLVRQSGTGTLLLSNANSYAGGTEIDAGAITIGNVSALGTGGIDFRQTNTNLRSSVTGTIPNNIIIDVFVSPRISAAAGQSLTLGGNNFTAFGGGGTTLHFGSSAEIGVVVLAPAVTALVSSGGAFSVDGGTLRLGTSLGRNVLTNLDGGATVGSGSTSATLDLNGFAPTLRNLTGTSSGIITNNGAPANLTVNNTANSTFGGVIQDGAGAIGMTKTGSGTLTLTGANIYTGDTLISSGTLQLGNGGDSGNVAGNVIDNGVLVFNHSSTGTFFSAISGTGTVVHAGTGTTLLTNTNTYTGGTTISAGALILGAFGTTGSIVGDVVDNSAFGIAHSDDVTFANAISGTGAFLQFGAGTTTFTNTNTYSGGTAILNGTLQIGNSGTMGSIAGDVFDNAALAFNRSDNFAFGGVISGPGTVTKLGAGTLTLAADNTYTGATTISAGTLQIGNGGTAGSIAGNITDNAVLAINRSDMVTVSGNISGSGSLQQIGPGTTILTGTNTYAGGTVISAGTLQIGDGGMKGTLAGNITDNGLLVFNVAPAYDFPISGVISGSGSVVQMGLGVTVLSGANTYTGGTAINAGVMKVSSDSNLGAASGGLSFDGGTLQFLADTDIARAITLNAGGGTLTSSGSVSGPIGGPGRLTVDHGVIALTGTNSYSGGTTISNGTVAISSDANLGASAGNLTLNGELIYLASFDSARGATLFDGVFNTNGFSGTWSGVIAGSGSLTKTGAGTLTLAGVNTYTGGTHIEDGTLAVSSDANLGHPASIISFGGEGTLKYLAGFSSAHGVIIEAHNPFVPPFPFTAIIDTNGFSSTLAGRISDQAAPPPPPCCGAICLCASSGAAVYGPGSVTKIGAGTLTLSGINTYTGGTNIFGGTLAVSSDANLGDTSGGLVFDGATLRDLASFDSARAVTLNAGGGTLDTNGFSSTLSGVIGGAGSLTKAGAGTLTLTGANNFSGGITVASGTLSLGSDGAAGSGTITTTGSVIDYANGVSIANAIVVSSDTTQLSVTAGSATQAGVISETGGARPIQKIGAGTLTLSGANTYSGGTFFNAGTLQVSADDRLGAAGGALHFDGGALQFGAAFNIGDARLVTLNPGGGTFDTNSFNSTLGQVVDGVGGLTKAGAGTLTLTASETYSGGTTVNAGTLLLGSGAALVTSSNLTVNGGTFDLNSYTQTIGDLSGAGGTLALGSGALTLGTNSSSTFSGLISGTGALVKQGSGTLTLTGANTYTGGTTISAGTLQIGNGGLSGSIAGNVVDNAALVFNRAGNLTYGGVISGSGGIVKLGAGTLIFSNDNTYSGTTTINAGTLQIGAGGPAGSVSGNIVNNATLVFNHSLTYSNVISGTGTVTVASGTVVLSRANAYSGGTNVNAGALEVGNNAALGTGLVVLANGARLQSTTAGLTLANDVLLMPGSGSIFPQNVTLALNGVISGAGTLNAQGTKIVLNGIDTYTGGTKLFGGTVQIGNNGALGTGILTTLTGTGTLQAGVAGLSIGNTINMNGTGFVFDTQAFTMTLTGALIGGLPFSKTGAGTLVFASGLDVSGFSLGGIVLQQGTLSLQRGLPANFGQIQPQGAAVIDYANSVTNAADILIGSNTTQLQVTGTNSTATQAGVILEAGGARPIEKIGAGMLVLTGINTYTGGTRISAGTLQLGNGGTSGSVTGNVVDNGTLVFNHSNATTFGGVISGSGGITQQGPGKTALTAANTYTGATIVNAGTLSVNGSIASSGGVTVNAGGTLAGTGTVAATTINGGTLAPGNSIGTISVGGNLSLANTATYAVEVSPSAADRTNVTGAASVAGTLQAIATGGTYTIGSQYTVLAASGGVGGAFSNISIVGNFGATRPRIGYDATDVFVVLDPNAISPSLTNSTANQAPLAGAIDKGLAAGNADLIALFNVSAAALPTALDQLTGEIHASVQSTLVEDSRFVRQAVMGRLSTAAGLMRAQAALGPTDPGFWVQGFGSWGQFDGNGNSAAAGRSIGGVFAGLDGNFGMLRAGAAVGYSQADIGVDARDSTAHIDTIHIATYGGARSEAWNLRFGGAYAWHTVKTDRAAAFGGFSDSDTAHYHGETGQLFGELGYILAAGPLAVEPYAGLAYVHASTDSFDEMGSGAALTGAHSSNDTPYGTLGVTASSDQMLGGGQMLTLHGNLAWQHAFGRIVPSSSLAFASTGAGFLVSGVPLARDSALIDFGLDFPFSPGASFGVAYSGQFASHLHDNGIRGRFSYRF